MSEDVIYRFQVRDLMGEAQIKKFVTREGATKWFSHLFEVRPNSRCVIEEIYEEDIKETK